MPFQVYSVMPVCFITVLQAGIGVFVTINKSIYIYIYKMWSLNSLHNLSSKNNIEVPGLETIFFQDEKQIV